MKAIPLLLVTLIAQGSNAQNQVKLMEPSSLRLDPQLHKDKAAIAGMQAAGITGEQQELVLTYSDPQYWPQGLRTDSARRANTPYLQNYAAFVVCTYTEDSTQTSVIMLPARENIHMPEDLRPIADVYLVVGTGATSVVEPPKPRPVISRGPKWKDRPQARIIQPGELYATYDLADDQEALDELARRGMSQPEIDAVIFRSHERNWPEGIDQFEERFPELEQFRKYKAYLGAKWGEKVLLIVPVEKNKKMPVLLRPYVDIYFIYAASAVEVKAKK